jgi:hypothetical protein
MKLFADFNELTVETLVAIIARSPIVVESPIKAAPCLPAGFDAADIAVLDWIVAEGRRLGRGIVQM